MISLIAWTWSETLSPICGKTALLAVALNLTRDLFRDVGCLIPLLEIGITLRHSGTDSVFQGVALLRLLF